MDVICPKIEELVSCYSCGSQALPPYRLCSDAHVGCPVCVKYLSFCACGQQYPAGPHSLFDWLVSAMKLKCKYRGGVLAGREAEAAANGDGPRGECDASRWYDLAELREHYRTGCSMNVFACPLDGCGHRGRVDTIVDHYEAAHGPFEQRTPIDPNKPQMVKFYIPPSETKVVRKIFNGYFLFAVKSLRHKTRDTGTQLVMQNINPADPLKYKYEATTQPPLKGILVTVSLLNRIEGFI